MKCPRSYFLAEALKKNFWTQTIFEKGRVSITQKTLWFHPSCREHTHAHTLSLMHPHPHTHTHAFFFLTLSFFVSFVWTGTHSQWHTHYVPISHTPARTHARTQGDFTQFVKVAFKFENKLNFLWIGKYEKENQASKKICSGQVKREKETGLGKIDA